MPSEAEKRKHRCCFSGHRPEKLKEPEEEIKQWLYTQIRTAIAQGYTTFISGCAMGVDIWAGQIVAGIREKQKAQTGHSEIRLIAATPWPGFSNRWSIEWQQQYSDLLKNADLIVPVSKRYEKSVFEKRNEWMVDHSSRLIVYFNGEPGGTRNTIEYAQGQGVEVVSNDPVYVEKIKRPRTAEEEPLQTDYPENLIAAIGLERVFGEERYNPLSEDQLKGLGHIIGSLQEKDRQLLEYRFKEKRTFQQCGDHFGFTRQRAQQIAARAVKKLRHPGKIIYIQDGFEKTELSLKLVAAEEMKKQLLAQKKRYPLMQAEDVVKFVFQGMLGVGHLISSQEKALEWLAREMQEMGEDRDEPLIEKISPQWVRMNLRAARREGISEADICYILCESARKQPLSFTRQNVYNFCVKLDGSAAMKAAAEKVLDENWLPSHSERYREAYQPAYRVLHKNFRKFKREEE